MSTQKKSTTKINKVLFHGLLLLIIGISFILNYLTIFDHKMDRNGDNYNYFVLARNLADGNGYVSDIGPQVEPHLHFPPGYPVFLSLFFRIFPDNTDALKILNGVLLFISLILLFRIIRKTTGKYGVLIAFTTCLLCTFNPVLLRWSTIIMSEMLYIAISLGIIAVCVDLDIQKLKERDIKHIMLFALLLILVSASYFVRTMGISLILATILALCIVGLKAFLKDKSSKSQWIIPLIIAGGIVLSFAASKTCWDIRNDKVASGYKSDYLNTFMNVTGNTGVMENFDQWKSRIGTNFKSFVAYYIPQSFFAPEDANFTLYFNAEITYKDWILGLLMIAVMVYGIMSMKKVNWVVLFYIIITFGVLMLYQEQYAGLRYMVPLIPLMIGAFVIGVVNIVLLLFERILKVKNAKVNGFFCTITAALICYMLIPIFIENNNDNRLRAAIKTDLNYSDDDPLKPYILASQLFRDLPDNMIVSCRKPEIFYFNSNYRHSVPLPSSGTPEEVIEYFKSNKVDCVIIDTMFPTAYKVVMPAVYKYPNMFNLFQIKGNEDHPTYVALFM